jgi:DNA helicase HerA-like ATPase
VTSGSDGQLPPQVAIVGSPSSNAELTLNLTADAYDVGLVGSLVYVRTPLGSGEECALGTVTQVITTNQWHHNASLLGVVKSVGEIPGLTGDGDVRSADVRLQAAFHRPAEKVPWAKTGPSLSMSPQTGTHVRRVTNGVIKALLTPEDLAHVAYLGGIYRNDDLALPVNMRDFADDRGAIHTGIFGTTGSGKSAIATLMLACQFRHPGLGVLFIDPQGQFSDDNKTLLPLQELARALGRSVQRLRIAHDLQLQADPDLLCGMLARTEFFDRLDMSHEITVQNASRAIRDFLEDNKGWTAKSPEELLHALLDHLDDQKIVEGLIKSADRRKEIRSAIERAKTGAGWERVLRDWAPLHSLFTERNLTGSRRQSLWGVLSGVLDPAARSPRPYIVIDMSAPATDDGAEEATTSGLTILNDAGLKARLLRMIVGTLRSAAEKSYREDHPLNTLVMFDEAHRYAPPSRGELPNEIRALTNQLADCARETRKYGVGWTYITQNIGSLNPTIFDMLGVRICGYGLGTSDLRAMEDHIDSKESLQLYRTFANPEQTNQYPYMIAGPFSPLSFTQAPLFVTTFRPDEWLQKNAGWISEQSQRHGPGLRQVTLEALKGAVHRRSYPPSPEEKANPSTKGRDNLSSDGVTRVRSSLTSRTNPSPE